MTKELVYDQDHLLVVSENHGDILFTQAFAAYRKERKFQIHLCRKSDPESKGRIENVVKFVKYSFGRGRLYTNIAKLNESSLAWLIRTGNGKMHNTTKKIPAEVHALEKQHLQPIYSLQHTGSLPSITRDIRKDNTVGYLSNRYSVPLGTYDGTSKEALLRLTPEGELLILDNQTQQEIARHVLCLDKGKLIKNNSHGRDRSKGISAYIEHVAQLGPDPASLRTYLDEIHRLKPRYIRDQLQSIEKHMQTVTSADTVQALMFCTKNRLYGAQHFTDALHHFNSRDISPTPEKLPLVPAQSEPNKTLQIHVPVRDMKVYEMIMAGESR